MNQKLFSKDFILVVIGQIISLFGNAALRFAMPLYLLNETGSSAVFGTVTACAVIPAILLSPVGGMVADRVNKRNVMVILDFFTAALISTFVVLMGGASLVVLLTVTLMILYGIAGAYQPSVQASIPVLVGSDRMMEANSIVNMISSFSALLGPVLGGIVYSAYGLKPVLLVCIACFVISAVMEIFIHIPFEKQASEGSVWQTVRSDFGQSIRFISKDMPVIGKAVLAVCGINLFLSSMINVGLPYLVTEVIDLDAASANRLYGFAEGILAAGGIAGGVCAGVLQKTFRQKGGYADCDCRGVSVPHSRVVSRFFVRHGNLCDSDGRLFRCDDLLYGLHHIDDDVLPDGDAAPSSGQGGCGYHYRGNVRPAARQRHVRRFV